MQKKSASWQSAVLGYFDRRMILVFCLGFSSGLPLALTGATFQVWQAEIGMDLTTIGIFTLVGASYSLKFVWSPLIDRMPPPPPFRRFGRRRGWALATQIPLALSILLLGFSDPAAQPELTALVAVALAFFSASQDIVIDGLRIEMLKAEEQATGAAMVIYGYRLGATLIAGAGALYLAEYFGWGIAYAAMAAAIGIGILAILAVEEPPSAAPVAETKSNGRGVAWAVFFVAFALILAFIVFHALGDGLRILLGEGKWQLAVANFLAVLAAALTPPILLALLPRPGKVAAASYGDFHAWLQGAIFKPFADIAQRESWLALLTFIVLYKLGDAVLGVNASAFYINIGFDKTQIASVTKVFGLIATLVGTFLGGLLVYRFGIAKALMIGGILQAASNLMFALQADVGPDIRYFYATIGTENLTGGLGAVVLVGYLSAICNKAFTATQYALFSSLAALGRVLLAAPFSGLPDAMGWVNYYFLSALLGLPGLLMLYWMMKHHAASLESVSSRA